MASKLALERKAQKERLLHACEQWIIRHEVSAPESIMQVDRVQEALPELAESVCSILGYFDYDSGEVRRG